MPAAFRAPNFDVMEGLIKLDVVVTDSSGKPVSGLEAKDFTLLDNSQPKKILSFDAFDQISSRPNSPVEVILFIDALYISEDLASKERVGVEEFLRQNGGQLSQSVSIFGLSQAGLWTIAKPSGDGNELAAQIAEHKEVIIRSAMPKRDGMSLDPFAIELPALTALKALGEIAAEERRKPSRKVLLWIGPGYGVGTGAIIENGEHDQSIFDTATWFSTLLREARIALYTLSLGDTDPRALRYTSFLDGTKSAKQVSWMNLYKKVLAIQSGGGALDKVGDLVGQMNKSVQEASVFYTLSFDPPRADHPDEYHDLKVQVSRTDLTARTKTGYYDQPYYCDLPNPAATLVTVAQLEQVLRTASGKRDAAVAQQLSDLELTERLSGARLSTLTANLRGEKSRRALVAVADAAAFLDPPRAEIPVDAQPDALTQSRLISLATDYLQSAIPKLPNFFATRTTDRYEDTPQYSRSTTRIDYEPLHWTNSSKETVLFRNGHEIVEAGTVKSGNQKAEDRSLTTDGTFGPLLGVAMDIIANPSNLTWSRWGQSATGNVAVFRYVVAAKNLDYRTEGCCLPDGDGTGAFRSPSSYRGEIEIDPSSGALLRLKLEAELKSTTPFVRYDLMIEYGPVEIGGKLHISPVRSVSISRVRSVHFPKLWDDGFRTYGPYSTLLNDITFADYHVFQAQSRVLTGFSRAPDEKSPESGSPHPPISMPQTPP